MNFNNIIAKRSNKTIYRDGDKVIKVFSETYSKSDVLNEALNTARVEETGLNVPKLLEVCMIDEKWSIITEFIDGKTIGQLMEEHPENAEKYLERFVDIQLDIQDKRSPLLNKLKDKMNRKISSTSLDATTRYDLHTRLESMPKHVKICHGDYSLNNVIIDKNDKAYVIDWAHVTQGNASADAARTYLIFCLKGQMELAEHYLSLFCNKSDTAKQYVQQWLPIVAASQSVKCKPEERDFLLHWVNVVDYE